MIEHKCCVVGIASSGQGPVFLFFLFFLCLSRGAEQHFLFFRRAFSKVGNSRLHSTQSDCGVRLSTASCFLTSKQASHAMPGHAIPQYTPAGACSHQVKTESPARKPRFTGTRVHPLPPPPLPQHPALLHKCAVYQNVRSSKPLSYDPQCRIISEKKTQPYST